MISSVVIETRARKQFARDARTEGAIPDEPGDVSYDASSRVVTLANVRGVLARYRVEPSVTDFQLVRLDTGD